MQLASMRLPTIRVVVARTTEFCPTMHQPKGLDSLAIVAALMVQSQARTTRRLSILFAIFVTPREREREHFPKSLRQGHVNNVAIPIKQCHIPSCDLLH